MADKRKRALGGTEGRPAYLRKRAAQACVTCRRRRTKCDNEHPSCTSCIALQVECSYGAVDKGSFDPASLAILQRLDDLEALYKILHKGTATPTPLQHAQHSLSPPEEHVSPHSVVHDIDETLQIRFVNVETVLSWPIGCLDDFRSRPSLLRLLRTQSGTFTQRWLLAADVGPKEATDLLRLFLAHFHVYNPVLDVRELEEQIRCAAINGLGWDARSCLLLLVYALGSTVREDEQPSSGSSLDSHSTTSFQRAETFFLAAQKRMGPLLLESGTIEAQVFFLAGVYLMTTMRPVEAWRSFVQALTCCQSFESTASELSSAEGQMQHGIYWTCFKSELEVRMELGVTETSVWNLRYPVAYPEPPKYLRSEGEPAWYFYLAEIALRRLENRVLMSNCGISPGRTAYLESAATAFDFETQVNTWAQSLPPALQINGTPELLEAPGDTNQSFRFILKGHYIDCLEMIYWSFCEGAICGRLHNDRDCNILAERGLELCVTRIKQNERGYYHRHHGTWLMLRSCTRSALVLVVAARSRMRDKLPPGWREAVQKVIRLLEHWKDEVADARDRLELLKVLFDM
ncbi:hypothetical protein yc1106_08606 [Curvularia clavata]|uniref:Zn(2)-C6 fungal-type domain-containing protein n=1 Tax=Curvularia clavata TaxID=95742 RepID=A0A9Q8ZG29_CURCL|nr:hypothetical protein yc1106_08606 [Curvularia clavata]